MVSILNSYILSVLRSTTVIAIMPKVKKSRRKSEALCQQASVRMTSGSQAPSSRTAGKSTGNFSETIVNRLRQAYSKAADGAKAMQMKRYMRDQFEFYGLSAAERRAIDKQVLDDLTLLDVENLRQLLLLLWQQPQREFQMFGTDLATRCWQVLAGEEGRCKTSLDCVKELITTKSWWDTVDMLASNVVGKFVLRYPTTMVPVMEEWVEDENLWLRRTAILHQLKAKHNTDQGRLFRMCLQCCHEKEFFIQKAIGWALREHHKLHPQDVREFVQDNRHRLAKLSQREALKHA